MMAPGAPSAAAVVTVSLPLRFILTGLLALGTAAGLALIKPTILSSYHYNQHVIAVTHLITLGFATSVVMGAMYQLVPVALETRLHSERLARWHFPLHLVGFAGMVWMFWVWNMEQVGHFGSVLALGVGLFVYNLIRTLATIPRWNVIAGAVASALFWLVATVLLGLAVAAAKCAYSDAPTSAAARAVAPLLAGLKAVALILSQFDALALMHAHAHLGVVGVFLMLMVGVSFRLVPMFTLSEIQNPRRAAGSVALLNVGLAGVAAAIALRSWLKPVFTLVVIAALMLYGLELRAILRARRRRALDWGLKHFLAALGLLIPLAALGLVLSWPTLPLTPAVGQWENVYGFGALFGVVTLAILGMLYKIVPFLVWLARYSPWIGRARVPQLAEMYSQQLQPWGFWLFLAGLGLTTAAVVAGNPWAVRGGVAVLAAGLAVFAANLVRVLWHLVQPRIEPFSNSLKPIPHERTTPY